MNNEQVLDVINKKGLAYTMSGHDYLIKCLNPEHNDRSPSLRVDKVTGAMHCFACAFKGNLFSYFGIKNNFVSIKVIKLKEKIRAIQKLVTDVEFPHQKVPFSRAFRGISSKVYRQMEAFTCNTMDKMFIDRLFFPIKNISGNVVAYIGRKVDGGTNKDKYYVYPSGTPLPVYPLVFEDKKDYVVLVEGIFDYANMLDKGLPNTACIFGVSAIQKSAEEHLMPFKAQGISRVFLMLDSDEAGIKATKDLKPIIEELGFGVDSIELPTGKDPGDLTQEEVDYIKEYIENERSN